MKTVFKLRLWGDRLGPTDVPEPLFELLYSPFNLLQYFKDVVHRSKIDDILVSDPGSEKASGSELTCFRVGIMLHIFAHCFTKPNINNNDNNPGTSCTSNISKKQR